jgi:glycerophosphoryl diester phosphodiesterase
MGDARETAKSTTADHLMPNWFITTKGLVDGAGDQGKSVIPYTVDNPVVASFVRGNGVTGIITNKPHSYPNWQPKA